MQWLFLMLVTLYVMTLTYAHNYLKCTEQTHLNPGVCDCTETLTTRCFINLTLTKRKYDNRSKIDESLVLMVNGGRIGPTIITRYNQLVVVDVYNKINDPEFLEDANTSMHWHGMHQWNTAFMDGVAMITQWGTKPREAFRHVFWAKPGGTHWYHSHVLNQRDKGIVGALIVQDKKSKNTNGLLQDVNDEPAKRMLAIRDHEKELRGSARFSVCEPDDSESPLDPLLVGFKSTLGRFRINGVPLVDSPIEYNEDLTFFVEARKKYRFRIVGIMASYVIRFSIFKHKLQVIATDGYLTEPYPVDSIDIHVGERYDFILETNQHSELPGGNIFPIQIETVAVECKKFLKPSLKPLKVSYAFLKYSVEIAPPKSIKDYPNEKPKKYNILNCPFKRYADGSNYICHSVENLQLLNPTPEEQLPTGEPDAEYFFNFGFRGSGFAAVNNVSNDLPTNIPFTRPDDSPDVENECDYGRAPCEGRCAHSVRLEKVTNPDGTLKVQKLRFVFSSLTKGTVGNSHTASVVTHPIHLHGHSFFVAKIGYPKYNCQGYIEKENEDLTIPECGPGHWTNNKAPEISINATTVRKDVIIVPAGGYVVIEFLADNPGWWFLHCHIDGHLIAGMGVAINELPECNSGPLNRYFSAEDSYWKSKWRFGLYWLFGNKCHIKRGKHFWRPAAAKEQVFADETEKLSNEHEEERKSDEINLHNMRQKTFNPVANINRDDQFASPYYKRLLHQRSRAHAADPELRRFQDIRQRNEHAPEWNK